MKAVFARCGRMDAVTLHWIGEESEDHRERRRSEDKDRLHG